VTALFKQELTKDRKRAEESATLTDDMKQSVIDEKIRVLNASIKRMLSKKDATVEIFVMKGKSD
jgi:hypothetical protein